MKKGVFSQYELREMGIKTSGSTEYRTANCVGSCEEEMEAKVVTKKCRGVVAKEIVKGTGNGTLKISMHVPLEIYDDIYGMELDSLIEGVRAYGQNSVHPTMSITQHVYDEDGEEMYKAYPNCILENGTKETIKNGAEEVAEVELEIKVMPDDYGNGKYQALVSNLKDETAKSTWMTAFEPDLVMSSTASA